MTKITISNDGVTVHEFEVSWEDLEIEQWRTTSTTIKIGIRDALMRAREQERKDALDT